MTSDQQLAALFDNIQKYLDAVFEVDAYVYLRRAHGQWEAAVQVSNEEVPRWETVAESATDALVQLLMRVSENAEWMRDELSEALSATVNILTKFKKVK